jgi:hypothetical protein
LCDRKKIQTCRASRSSGGWFTRRVLVVCEEDVQMCVSSFYKHAEEGSQLFEAMFLHEIVWMNPSLPKLVIQFLSEARRFEDRHIAAIEKVLRCKRGGLFSASGQGFRDWCEVQPEE